MNLCGLWQILCYKVIRKVLCLFQNWKYEDNLKIPLPTIHTTSWSWRECESLPGNDLAVFHLWVETDTDDSTWRTAYCFAGCNHLKKRECIFLIHCKLVQSTLMHPSVDGLFSSFLWLLLGMASWKGIYIIEDMLIAADRYWLRKHLFFKKTLTTKTSTTFQNC